LRRFLVFSFLFFVGVLWFKDFVASGRLLAKLDENRDRRGTATVLYYWARLNDIMNDEDEAIPLYERIVDRYPKSRYGMEAHYGLANCWERKKRYDKAVEEYQAFLENYPDSRYAVSVRNNIDILKFQ
jgi:tetratricopeptide (TPR) repeat protein